eukprot:3812178-Pyramimonas_sp.AAC.1
MLGLIQLVGAAALGVVCLLHGECGDLSAAESWDLWWRQLWEQPQELWDCADARVGLGHAAAVSAAARHRAG